MLRFISLFVGFALLLLGCLACEDGGEDTQVTRAPTTHVNVHVFNKAGKLVGPLRLPVVRKEAAAWQSLLGGDAYRILRRSGTEPAHCGDLLDNKKEGVYTCAGCGLPLFSSQAKFTSGTGWPSFFQPIAPGNIDEHLDTSYDMRRTEIRCARCEGHLGHVFRDGPKPTGLRFCLNSLSMKFTSVKDLASLADPAAEQTPPKRATAVFAGGCFWCVEAVFEQIDGVIDAVSGYAGGRKETANYKSVSAGGTKHAEVVQITYDPRRVTFSELLAVHFATHDPTTLNRQGNDVGPHYRSAIFFASPEEKREATAWLAEHQKRLGDEKKITTTLEAFTGFYPAEPYHQDFVCRNPNQGYVAAVAQPKLKKVRKVFPDRVKPDTESAKTGREAPETEAQPK